MIIGDIDLTVDGIAREYNNFRQLYGSQINALWLANFNKEDIANKSDEHFTILQYINAFQLAHIIKEDYLLGLNNTTISGVDIALLRTKLRNNNIDLDAIFKAINLTEKVFELRVVDDEVKDTVGGREIDTDLSSITSFPVTTEDGLDVFTNVITGSAKYLDTGLLVVNNKDLNITFKVIAKAETTDAIIEYDTPNILIRLYRTGTSLAIVVNTLVNKNTYTFTGTYSTSGWFYVNVNIKSINNVITVTPFVNGSYRDTTLAILTPTPYTPVSSSNLYHIDYHGSGTNRYHVLSCYRGQSSKQDIFKEYLHYKNLITI